MKRSTKQPLGTPCRMRSNNRLGTGEQAKALSHVHTYGVTNTWAPANRHTLQRSTKNNSTQLTPVLGR